MQLDEQNSSFVTRDQVMRIILVGKTGNGKSSTGNVILGGNYFETKFSAQSFTIHCSKAEGIVDGQRVAVIDTPGLFDTRSDSGQTILDISRCISLSSPGPHVLLVVVRLGRFTTEEQQAVQKIQEIFGPAANRYSMVLFTHGDLLEDTFEDFLNESPELRKLVKRCNGEYHMFNNKSMDRSQVTQLLQKIRRIVEKNGGSYYIQESIQEAERNTEKEKQRVLAEEAEKDHREKQRIEEETQAKFYQEELERMMAEYRAEEQRERQIILMNKISLFAIHFHCGCQK